MLRIENVNKTYDGATPVLRDVSVTVAAGEIVCLLGPSGCGKTTLLRIVAGLEAADQGTLHMAGEDLARVPVHLRNFGLMFQEFALFPHKSVGENVAFGLRMAGQLRSEIGLRVDEMLALVSLEGYARRSIFELSGGERQRVALARSLAPNPRLLMLDEPLGSLDRALREELMTELRSILKQVGVTALYVTHDQEEAYAVADRLVVMNRGEIAQVGTPAEIYYQPQSEFVARFLGFSNLLPGSVIEQSPQQAMTPIGRFTLARATHTGNCTLLIRPDAASIGEGAAADNAIAGTVIALSFRGGHYRTKIAVDEAGTVYHLEFMLPAPNFAQITLGQPIMLSIDPAGVTPLAQ